MARKAQPARKALRETPLQIRLTTEEKRMFSEAAEREHLTISAWLRRTAVQAVQATHPAK